MMFSNRIDGDISPNELSVSLKEKKDRGETIFDLTQSNPTQAGFLYDEKEILSALSRIDALVYEPDPRGLIKARQAICGYYHDIGEKIAADDIFLTASTSEAYSMIFKLLGNPGDKILIPSPGYPLIPYLAGFENLNAVPYPLRYDDKRGWWIDTAFLESLVTPGCRAIVLVNPNNPTGNYLKKGELTALDAICRENGMAMIVDEVFSDYCGTESSQIVKTAVNRTNSLTFVLNGFSKTLGLPQVKLGWIAIQGNTDLTQEAKDRLEILLDFYLSVSVPVQHGAQALLALRQKFQQQINTRIAANSLFLRERIERSANSRLLRREGGWYAVIEFTDGISDDDRILHLLMSHNTLVHPGYFYEIDQNGMVIVSLLTPVAVFRKGISCLLSSTVSFE